MKIQIGANPLCWMNSDFPHLGEGITVEKCLSDISKIGYAGVEMEDPFLKVVDRLPDLLAEYHLLCIGKWHSTHILERGIEEEMGRLKRHVDMLEKLNGDVVNLAECSGAMHQQKETPLSKRPQIHNSEDWKILCAGMETMATYIEQRGMKSAYHHHMGTIIQTKEDILRLLEGTKALGLLFDSGHLAYAGEDPLDVLQQTLTRITHIHCKSVRPSILSRKIGCDSSFFSAVLDGVFTVPGDPEDSIDYEKIIQKLVTSGYNGWIVMEAEQDPNKADPYTYADLGYQSLKKHLDKQESSQVAFR